MPGVPDRETGSDWIAHARSRLAQRRAEKPATKVGQIRALWPEIEAALTVGQSVKSIRRWLEEDAGIKLGLTSLTSYISRIRRREKANPQYAPSGGQAMRPDTERTGAPPSVHSSGMPPVRTGSTAKATDDPLASAMRVLSRPKMDIRKIHNDGDPEGRNLI